MYGNCILIDGPHKGGHVPFHGMPRYGTMIELARHVDGGLFRSPRDVTDIYKVIEEDYDAAKAHFVGTIEHPARVSNTTVDQY